MRTIIQITLAVIIPTQIMEKNAMITLQVTNIKIRNAKMSEIKTPRTANYWRASSVTVYAKL